MANPNFSYQMPGNNYGQGMGGYMRGPSGTMVNPSQAPAAGPNYMGLASMLAQYVQQAQAQQQQAPMPPPQIMPQRPMQQLNMYPFRRSMIGGY